MIIEERLWLCHECGTIVKETETEHAPLCPGAIGWSRNNLTFLNRLSEPPYTVFN